MVIDHKEKGIDLVTEMVTKRVLILYKLISNINGIWKICFNMLKWKK